MPSLTQNPWFKHAIAIVVFLLTAWLYFYPTTFEGKVIGNQTDRIQSLARQQEVKEFKEKEGRPIYWTNAIFSGMPSTLIGEGHPDSYDYVNLLTINVFRMFKKATTPYSLFFGGFLGMYFLLLVLKVDWRLAIGGSIVYGLSTSHLLILEGGHFSKLQSIIFCPPFLAALILLLRKKYIIGAVLLALFGSVLLRTGHVQIVFYFGLLMALYGVLALISQWKKGESINHLAKTMGFVAAAGILAFLPNLYKMWALQSYGKESIRGKTELIQENRPSDGLDRDYVFGWSMGKVESMSVLIPNIKGGTSGEAFVNDRDSESFKALRGNPNANQLAQFTRKYWGDQPFVGGAYYFGVVMVLLFMVGLFLVNSTWRWWAIGSMAIIFILGWGRNLGAINFFLFENIPPFNKFRAVNMIFILGHIVVVLIGIKGLDLLLRQNKQKSWEAIKKGSMIMGGILLLGLIMSYTMSMTGPQDQMLVGKADAFLSALEKDRASIIRSDVFRALVYFAIALGLMWAWTKSKLSTSALIFIGLAVALVDIVSVNLRYVYPDKFVKQKDFERMFAPRPVDNQILKDSDLHYRVFDISNGDPFNNNLGSYHHRLVGGYHPAKLRRYQELIERYLSKPDQYPQVFNMLNTKYFIRNNGQQQPVVMENSGALGNAWFVENVQRAENANIEIDALAQLDPAKTAVVNSKFLAQGAPTNFGSSMGNSIQLTSYIPDHLTYQYEADKERLVVFSEIFYPEEKGWKVYIDGDQKIDLKRANYVLNAAMVPAGKHKLELRFEPDGTTAILSISRIGSILLSLLFLFMLYQVFFQNKELSWAEPNLISEEKSTVSRVAKRSKKK